MKFIDRILLEAQEPKIVYHAMMVDNPEALKRRFPPVHPNEFYHHSTIIFRPESAAGIEVGRQERMRVTGRLTTDKIDLLLVENPKSTRPNPHITLSTAEGVSPAAANVEIEENRDKVKPMNFTIPVTEGYFDGKVVTGKDSLNEAQIPLDKYFKDVDPNFYGFINRDVTKFTTEKAKRDIVNRIEKYRLSSGEGLPEIEIDPNMLIATQKTVEDKKVENMNTDKPSFVVKLNWTYYLLDGHHRVTQAKMDKARKVTVRLLDLDDKLPIPHA